MESALNGISFSLLLTSLYILRFRGWKRPLAAVGGRGVFRLLCGVGGRFRTFPAPARGVRIGTVDAVLGAHDPGSRRGLSGLAS